MRTRSCLPILALSLLVCACGGRVEAARRLHVILITVDGLRADHLGCYGHGAGATPGLDALAASSVRYEYALSAAPWSTPAHAALLCGRYPSELGLTDLGAGLGAEARTLAELLHDAGWRTRAVVSHRFAGSKWRLDQGFERFDDELCARAGATASEVTERGLAALDGRGGRPLFLWLQYADLRGPLAGAEDPTYEGPVAPGMDRAALLALARDLEPKDVAEVARHYDATLARVDAEVGRFLAGLEKRDLLDETLVVLTAPHGLELFDRGGYGDAASLYDELVRVPLLVRLPEPRAGVLSEPVSLVDVVPSVLDVLGLPADAELSGIPALPGRPAPERRLFAESSRACELRAVVEGDWKLIVDRERARAQLFDVYRDPREERDAADQSGLVRDRLEHYLADWERALPSVTAE
jgi:arylsulfatase